jgi:hypothetical protein
MLHIDIPTLAEFKALAAIKSDTCVSLYVPTSPSAERARQNRIALEDLAAQALSQLQEGGTDKRAIAPIEEHLRQPSACHTAPSRWPRRQTAFISPPWFAP